MVTPPAKAGIGGNMNRNIPSALAALILAIMAMFGVTASEDAPPPPETATAQEPVTPAAATIPSDLLEAVERERREIAQGGRAHYARSCLAIFPGPITRAKKLTGIPLSVLAGLAGYNSSGCTHSRGGPGNIMRVDRPDDTHVEEAAALLGVPKGTLNWHRHAEHSAVLGAVVLKAHLTREGSLVGALRAYGGSEEHAHRALAHGLFALRHLWRRETDYWVGEDEELSPVELRSLAAGLPLLLPEDEHALVSRE